MDISRRDMFKQLLGKDSLQGLSILLPGGLERLLGIDGIGLPGSTEEAGLALSRRRPNRSLKLADCTSPTNSSKSKAEALEDSASEKGVIPG
jgi:hypothetical protein